MPGQQTSPSVAPFAIGQHHIEERPLSRWRNRAAFALLAVMLLAALSGVLGGGPSHVTRARGEGLAGAVIYDPIVRSGNWYETVVTINARRDVKDLTIAIDQPLWQRMSIDTLAPDAESSEALDGRYLYHFGKVKAGQHFTLKLDGQIQPGWPRRQTGQIRVLEGQAEPARELMALPLQITVLP